MLHIIIKTIYIAYIICIFCNDQVHICRHILQLFTSLADHFLPALILYSSDFFANNNLTTENFQIFHWIFEVDLKYSQRKKNTCWPRVVIDSGNAQKYVLVIKYTTCVLSIQTYKLKNLQNIKLHYTYIDSVKINFV